MSSPSNKCPMLDGYDPFSQEFSRNPDPILAKAHAEQPVFWYEPLQCYFVTGFADVERVFRDSKVFSARAVRTIPPPEEFRGILPEKPMDIAFINTNDPQHKVDRRVANQGFTRPKLEAMGPRIAEFTQELIDGFRDRGECDFMADFAYPLSLRVIVDILGLSPEDMPKLRWWTECMFTIMSAGPADAEDAPVRPMEAEEAKLRFGGLADAWSYFAKVLEDRRANPRDDFCSLFANAKGEDGNYLMSDDTVKTHLLELVAAGNDTTANLMGNMVLFFRDNPAQLADLMAEPTLWPAAVEEALRRRPSAPHLMRIAAEDVELSGVLIPEGSVVVVNVTGANNDPAEFDAPLNYDLHRTDPKQHLAFGKGVHMCLGAPLARLEGHICMKMIFEQLPNLRVTENELTYIPTMTVQTLQNLHIAWDVEQPEETTGPAHLDFARAGLELGVR